MNPTEAFMLGDPAAAVEHLEALLQLTWTCNRRGELESLSPQFEAYTGKTHAQLSGAQWLDVVHPDDRPRMLSTWKQALKNATAYNVDYRLRRHDGVYRWFVSRATAIAGQSDRWFGFSTDSQAMFEARDAFEREQARLVRIAEVSPHAFYSFEMRPDGSASFPYVSKAFSRLYGEATAEVMRDGMQAVRLVHPDDVAPMIASMRASEKTLTPWHFEWRATVPGRGDVWFEADSVPVREGQTITFHGVMADITERKRHQAQVEQLNAKLEQTVQKRTASLVATNRELENFATSVSHDLRAPLRAINGFAQALVEDYGPQLPEGAQRFLRTVQNNALRMDALIEALLSFSRLSRQSLDRGAVNTQAMVDECIREAQGASPAEFTVGPLPSMHGDPTLLRKVWLNLISNALKYSKKNEHPQIEIGATTTDSGQTRYFVRDNGVGFDMAHAGKLFGVFQRLHRVDEFEGTGVGLAIVERVVTRHGGQVSAQGEVGRGATFSFTLGERDD